MFEEPLTQDDTSTVTQQIRQLNEAYYEFHCLCDFYVQGLVGIAAIHEALSVEAVAGSERIGMLLMMRSVAIMERIEALAALSRAGEQP